MKFYKIVNPDGHNGMIYTEGFNIDISFDPFEQSQDGGFSREDILAFLDLGTELYEVEPAGEVYKDLNYNPKSWKAHAVNLKYVGKVIDNIKFLVEQGANIHARDNKALRWAAEKGHLGIVKFLVEQGADIHALNDFALRLTASHGHLEVVKFLVENGAGIHANDNIALRWAAEKGHLDIVKYLVENEADIHAVDDAALRYAACNGHLEVVKFLVEHGADIHALNDFALQHAAFFGHLEVVKYLKLKDKMEMSNIMSKRAVELINKKSFVANDVFLGVIKVMDLGVIKVVDLDEAIEAVETAEEELLEKIKFAYQEECPYLMTGRYNRCNRTISKPCNMECDHIKKFIDKIKKQ